MTRGARVVAKYYIIHIGEKSEIVAVKRISCWKKHAEIRNTDFN